MKRVLTAEHKHKISIAMRGSNNPNYGGLTQDHRKGISRGMLKHWMKMRENCEKSL